MKEYREELEKILGVYTKKGYECYITPEEKFKTSLWGNIITPRGNILYIQRDTFHWRGWRLTLQYIPSKETGSGCSCLENDEPLSTEALLKEETIIKAEQEGLIFAKQLKAKLYSSVDEWKNKAYFFKDMLKVS